MTGKIDVTELLKEYEYKYSIIKDELHRINMKEDLKVIISNYLKSNNKNLKVIIFVSNYVIGKLDERDRFFKPGSGMSMEFDEKTLELTASFQLIKDIFREQNIVDMPLYCTLNDIIVIIDRHDRLTKDILIDLMVDKYEDLPFKWSGLNHYIQNNLTIHYYSV